jgi:hypothetical protein
MSECEGAIAPHEIIGKHIKQTEAGRDVILNREKKEYKVKCCRQI